MVPVRIFDRLDAIDRRLGLTPRMPPRKPPSPTSRWLARNRLLASMLLALPLAVFWVVGALLVEGLSAVGAALQMACALAVGSYLATANRNYCEAWDRDGRHSPPPSGAQTIS